MRVMSVTLSDGSTLIVEGPESQWLRRVLAACQLLGVEQQQGSASARLPRSVDAWLLVGDEWLAARVRELRSNGCSAWIYVVEISTRECIGEAKLLDAGADRYLTQPIDQETLAAGLRSLLRHKSGTYEAQRVVRPELREAEGALVLGDNVYVFSPRELAVLKYLNERAGQWVGRAQLLRDLFGAQNGHDPSVVRTHLMNIKRKLGSDNWLLRTHRVAGVMWIAAMARLDDVSTTSRRSNTQA